MMGDTRATFTTIIRFDCGCKVTVNENYADTRAVDAQIVYCPKHNSAPELYEASRRLALSLPNSELDLAREAWGHTNVGVVIHWRDRVLAALALVDKKENK